MGSCPLEITHRGRHMLLTPLQLGQVESFGDVAADDLTPAVHPGTAVHPDQVGRAAHHQLDGPAQLAQDRASPGCSAKPDSSVPS